MAVSPVFAGDDLEGLLLVGKSRTAAAGTGAGTGAPSGAATVNKMKRPSVAMNEQVGLHNSESALAVLCAVYCVLP
jgi:hypothetical protein